MKNEKIMVSINCVAYNHEDYIKDALESFLMQRTNFKYEILINDDASTDKTKEIIREYEIKYPDIIKPLYQKENQYSKGKNMYSFNNERARGKYIAYCEGDDFWTDPYKLQKQVDYMEKNLDCGLCFHKAEVLDHQTKKIINKISVGEDSKIFSVEKIIESSGGSIVPTASIMVRKNLIDDSYFYKKMCRWAWATKIFFSSKKYAYYLAESMSVYRTNIDGSWTNTHKSILKTKETFLELIDLLEKFNEYSKNKYNISVEKRIKKYCFYILKLDLLEQTISKKEKKKLYSKLSFLERAKLNFYKVRNYFYK